MIFSDAKGALARLDLSGNYTVARYSFHDSPGFIRPIAAALKTNTTITDLNLSNNNLNAEAAKILSEDIQDNGALASLDVSNNRIDENQKAKIEQICARKSIKCTL